MVTECVTTDLHNNLGKRKTALQVAVNFRKVTSGYSTLGKNVCRPWNVSLSQ